MHLLLMYSPHHPSEEHLDRLRAMHPDIELTVAESEEEAVSAAETAHVILGHRYLRQSVPKAHNLCWVQSTTHGVDRLPVAALEERGIMLTRFRGSAEGVGRHALALALSMTRALPDAWRRQEEERWDKALSFLPAPQRAIIFGTGAVGRAIARCVRGIGVEVAGVKREVGPDAPTDKFDRLYDRHSWHGAMQEADWCFLALPHTDETARMMDEDALRRLPDHAVVVNVGRGETLELGGLETVLEEGRLGGAALDVLPASLEPLPPDHPIWKTPRLLVTPHVAAYDPGRRKSVEEFVEGQLQRFLAKEPLKEVVLPGAAQREAEHSQAA